MKRFVLTCLGVLLLVSTATATKIGGVTLPDTLTFSDQQLALNGAGLRKKMWIKVYAGGLYLKAPTTNADAIIQADEPMAVRMHFIYNGVSAKKLIDAWNEGFEIVTDGNVKPLQTEIDQFNALFTREAKEGDRYDIVYIPEKGTSLYIDDFEMGTVAGLAFKQALFAIWLGSEPADEGLKEGMIGE